jgi:drug/metabolite transporter (DMT)-like permease
MILVLLLYFLFAVTFILAKGVTFYISPIFFVGIRMILAGLLLLGYQYWRNSAACFVAKEDRWRFLLIAFFHIFVAYVGEFWALQYVTAAKASLLFNLSPFITAFFSYLLFSEYLTIRQWVGLTVGCIGLFPILLSQTPLEELTTHISFLSMPEIALLIAVTASAYSWTMIKVLMQERSYTSIIINGYAMAIGGILSLVTSFIFESFSPVIIPAAMPLWGFSPMGYSLFMVTWYLVSLIIIANIISYNLYALLLAQYSATFLSFAGFTIPLFTALLDWLVFGEVVGLGFGFSILFVMFGLCLFYRDENKAYKRKS